MNEAMQAALKKLRLSGMAQSLDVRLQEASGNDHRRVVWDQIRQRDLRAFAKWLSPELLTAAATQAGIRVGQGPLYAVNLGWLAVSVRVHHCSKGINTRVHERRSKVLGTGLPVVGVLLFLSNS